MTTALISILAPHDAKANGYQGTINSSETHTNLSITSAGGFDTWRFTANKGDRIIINAVTTSGSLDTGIVLYNPQGAIEETTISGYGGIHGSDQLDWQLQTNGLYTIVIEDAAYSATGNYNITFFRIPGALTSMSNQYGGIITPGQSTSGFIQSPSDINEFQF